MATSYIITKRKAEAISNGVFLIALGCLFYFNAWWPGILLAIWAFLATRQSLMGRHFDLIVTTFILVGLFVIATFNLSWSILGPLLFVLGGAYIIFREYFIVKDDETEKR
jgi:predicted membrane protein